MKKIGWFLFICLSGLAASIAATTFGSPSIPTKILIANPVQAVEFSDLDFRDANNRPISDEGIRQKMQAAVSNGLFDLLINNLTPARRAILDLLNQNWRGTFGWWMNLLGHGVAAVYVWLREKRIVLAAVPLKHGSTGHVQFQPNFHFHTLSHSPALVILSSTQLLR